MYRADWTQAAIEQLKQLHTEALPKDKPAIVVAARRITDALLADAETVGESRGSNFRVVIERPLVAYFWIGRDEYVDIAFVTRVRLAKRPKPTP